MNMGFNPIYERSNALYIETPNETKEGIPFFHPDTTIYRQVTAPQEVPVSLH